MGAGCSSAQSDLVRARSCRSSQVSTTAIRWSERALFFEPTMLDDVATGLGDSTRGSIRARALRAALRVRNRCHRRCERHALSAHRQRVDTPPVAHTSHGRRGGRGPLRGQRPWTSRRSDSVRWVWPQWLGASSSAPSASISFWEAAPSLISQSRNEAMTGSRAVPREHTAKYA